MRVVEFLLQAIPLLIQLYSEKYLQDDLERTMNELENDSNVPRIKSYDFIVGKFILLLKFINFSCSQNLKPERNICPFNAQHQHAYLYIYGMLRGILIR